MTNRSLIERISPLWLGVGISSALLLILFVLESVFGRWDIIITGSEFDPLARVSTGVLRDLRITIVHCLVMGYLPAALLHAIQSSRRTVLVLQEVLECTRQECETLAASVKLSPRMLVLTGVAGLLLSFVVPYLIPPVPENPWNPSSWGPEVAWHRILGPAILVWGIWLTYAIVIVSLRLSKIARRLCRIDLLDLSPLTPFTQQGMTNALLLIGSFSIWSLMMIETGFGQMLWIIGGCTLGSTALALLLPLQGVHTRICHSKDKELGRVNTEIAKQWKSYPNRDGNKCSGGMADLSAYRGLVESVPEWPFTSSTYTRLFLYAMLPVATWGVGIFAEELAGRLLQ